MQLKKWFLKIFPKVFQLKIKILSLNFNELNLFKYDKYAFFDSDIYIFLELALLRSLCKFLIKKKAINIHMGVTPYYKGADNFGLYMMIIQSM